MSVFKRWNGTSWETIGPQISSTRFDDTNHMIASEYSPNDPYNVGDYVVQNDKLYKCVSAIESAEEWTPEHWMQISISREVSNLNSVLNAELTASNINGWDTNMFNVVYGISVKSASEYIRNNNYVGVFNGIFRIKAINGYKFVVYAYDKDNQDNYVGCLRTTGEFTKVNSYTNLSKRTEFDCTQYPSYKFRVSVVNSTESSTITPSDGQNILVINATDKTLTKENKSADAAKVGSEIIKLANNIVDITDNQVCNTFIENMSIVTNGSTYGSPSVNDGYCYMKIPASPGDIFTIKGAGGVTSLLWAFGDGTNVLAPKAESNLTVSDYIYIIAPQGSTELIFNSTIASNPEVIKGKLVKKQIEYLNENTVFTYEKIDKSKFYQRRAGSTTTSSQFISTNNIKVSKQTFLKVTKPSGNKSFSIYYTISDGTTQSLFNQWFDQDIALWIPFDGEIAFEYRNFDGTAMMEITPNDMDSDIELFKIAYSMDHFLHPITLNILTWNIGHFSKGQSIDSAITAETYAEQKAAFRALFNDVGADLVGLCEYSSIFYDNETARSAILNQYKYFNKTIQSGYVCNAIFSNFAVGYVFDKMTSSSYRTLEQIINIGGKSILISQLHNPWDSDSSIQTVLNNLVDRYSIFECVIICGDFNFRNDGYASEFEILTNAGYTPANDGYIGKLNTYIPTAVYTVNYIDNIFVKGGNILNTYMIRHEEQGDTEEQILAKNLSDHCPLISKI